MTKSFNPPPDNTNPIFSSDKSIQQNSIIKAFVTNFFIKILSKII